MDSVTKQRIKVAIEQLPDPLECYGKCDNMSSLKEIIFTVTKSLDGGYEAQAAGHLIFTQSDSYGELFDILRDAVKCHFDEEEMPALIRVQLVKNGVIAV